MLQTAWVQFGVLRRFSNQPNREEGASCLLHTTTPPITPERSPTAPGTTPSLTPLAGTLAPAIFCRLATRCRQPRAPGGPGVTRTSESSAYLT